MIKKLIAKIRRLNVKEKDAYHLGWNRRGEEDIKIFKTFFKT